MENVTMPLQVVASQQEVTAEDLILINRHTLRDVTSEEIFTYEGVCSSDSLDTYHTRMDPLTTLRHFTAELLDGSPLLEGHETSKNPYGRSFHAELIEDDTGATSVRGRWYIPRGITINGVQTDDTIRAIETGVITDMSVGFGGSDMWYRCSVDGKDLWDTPYYPGDRDDNGNKVFFWVVDAHLREVSTVYKGACPGAYIEKVRSDISKGLVDNNNIMLFEERYQTRFKTTEPFFIKNKPLIKRSEDMEMTKEAISLALKEGHLAIAEVQEVLKEKGVRFETEQDVALRNELGDTMTVSEVKQLKVEAAQGRSYTEDLIKTAVKERVAAQGEFFNQEGYHLMLERSGDITYIKGEIESYRKQKKERFTSGRQTSTSADDSDVLDLDREGGGK